MGASEEELLQQQLDAALGALTQMASGGGQTTQSYLGVPEGVTPTIRTPRPTYGAGRNSFLPDTYNVPRPGYTTDDVFKIRNWSAEQIHDLQLKMVQAGLITQRQTFRRGWADDTTLAAYQTLLELANRRGVTGTSALDLLAAEPQDQGFGDREPLVTRLPNPDDLRAVFDTVSRATLGRKVDPAEVDQMVRAYQQQAVGYQQTAYGMDETGGTITEVASPDVFAESELRKRYGTEAASHDVANTMSIFEGLI